MAVIRGAGQDARGERLDGAVEPVDVSHGGRPVRRTAAGREVGDNLSRLPRPDLAAEAPAFGDPALQQGGGSRKPPGGGVGCLLRHDGLLAVDDAVCVTVIAIGHLESALP